MSVFFDMFVPSRRHVEEERNRLEWTRDEEGEGDPHRGPIDLDSGVVAIRATGEPAAGPATDPETDLATDPETVPAAFGKPAGATAKTTAEPAAGPAPSSVTSTITKPAASQIRHTEP